MNRAGENPLEFSRGYDYAQTIVAEGAMVYVSGQGGFGADGSVVDHESFEAQLRQAYANIETLLSANGASLATIVKMTVYLARASDYDAFKRVRAEVFTAPYPASTAVVAGGFLFEGMLVEMDAVARVGEPRS
jgi:2-iminobutanoate/2-iminopropanoate deaminase